MSKFHESNKLLTTLIGVTNLIFKQSEIISYGNKCAVQLTFLTLICTANWFDGASIL